MFGVCAILDGLVRVLSFGHFHTTFQLDHARATARKNYLGVDMRNSEGAVAASECKPFKGSNFYGEWLPGNKKVYAVYSYGPHWPLAVWTADSGWQENEDRYTRPTTRRHASMVTSNLPPATKKVSVDYLKQQLEH